MSSGELYDILSGSCTMSSQRADIYSESCTIPARGAVRYASRRAVRHLVGELHVLLLVEGLASSLRAVRHLLGELYDMQPRAALHSVQELCGAKPRVVPYYIG